MNNWICLIVIAVAPLLSGSVQAGVGSKLIRETAELVIKRGGREVVEETAETLAKRMTTLAAKHTDDLVVAAVKKCGPRAVQVASEAAEHSGPALRLMSRYGDDALRVAARPKALNLLAKYGDDIGRPLIRHGEVGEKLIERFGSDGAAALGKLSDQNVRRLAILAKDQGENVTPGLVGMFAKHSQADKVADFVWRNKGALFVGGTLATFIAKPEPFLEAGEIVTTKALDTAGTVATETLESAVQPVVAEAASQFPWGPTMLIGLFVGLAVVFERIGVPKILKSGLAVAVAKAKKAKQKPLPRFYPRPKENINDTEIR